MNRKPAKQARDHSHARPGLAHVTLRISDPLGSLKFYRDILGMNLLAQCCSSRNGVQETHYYLGFIGPACAGVETRRELLTTPGTLLDLVHQPHHPLPLDAAFNTADNARYWKIGITLADVDIARARLLAAGVAVSEAAQFLDVGYLCHLHDYDGYCIELLQHDFAHNHKAVVANPGYELGNAPTLGQITLRISDAEASLHFYQDLLGMRLLSRQVVAAYQFTLYFLACTDDVPPNPDIDAVENREWLWQRPYTTLELQHVWRDDWQGLVRRTDADAGFRQISIVRNGLQNVVAKLAGEKVAIEEPGAVDDTLNTTAATVHDPDGNVVRLYASVV